MIVTLKSNHEQLRRRILGGDNIGKVLVQYDGNLIGTNEYKDFTCIAFTSRIELPPALYLAKSSLIFKIVCGQNHDGVEDTFRYGNRRHFCNCFLEAVKLLSMAESMVQGILRINRDPNSKEKVEVWIFDRSPLLIEVIKRKLNGCKVEVVELEELKTRRAGATPYIIGQTAEEMLKECEDERLSKSALREKLGLSMRALAYSLCREDVQKDFAERGMIIKRRYIEWVAEL